MSIVFEYRDNAADPDAPVTDFTDRINLAESSVSFTENAEELTVGASTLTVDDPDGDWNIKGYWYIRVRETEAPADNDLIWDGFVTIRHIKRAPGFLTGPARQWILNLDDSNTQRAWSLETGSEANRPAETDVDRIQWLFDQALLGPDDTYFSHANPVDMDASDYRGQNVYDIVNDCMLQSGKNAWQQGINDGVGVYVGTTWYDFANSTALEVDLQISNYISDITAEVGTPSPSGAAQTWYASLDTDFARDPTRVYWKILGQYDGGQVVRTRPATALEFAARDTTASWPLVKTATKANARADRQLLDISTEEDVIVTTIWVHPEHINDARAGRKIQARFSHLPGYEDWSWMRILNRTVTLETPEVYRIQYTLSPDAPHFVLSCATQLSDIIAGGWEEGEHHNVNDNAVPIEFSPLPTPTADSPSVVIGLWAGINQQEPIARGDQTCSVDGFTMWGNSRAPTSGTDFASLALAGYKAVASGAAGIMGATWTGAGTSSGAQSWNALGLQFATSATAPVQTGIQNGSGSAAVLGAAPTAGNLLVLARFTEQGSGFSSTAPGWQFVCDGPVIANLDNGYMALYVRCAEEGESATVACGDNSFAHWQFVSEWELT